MITDKVLKALLMLLSSVGLYSLFITFIWEHRNFIVTERPPDHIHSSANLSPFAFLWHQGNNNVMSF